ncbi:putative aminoglycoside phosphotransferase [Legionella steigerwaltii]|uniref:Aminoglycoside phosphotransferase n=1 Tax=Legionella steigerwaltii TaxID=460 RepID=A0A378LC34_9GAMM|nr:aminoglycoside phosphotransferase family protein [Legionella steigerwaltii]KTD78652.1 putative aminoglycoside phosphotransferase [Legionella steigerwaltii]STY24257.1 putative aminoglycoside phosphotransferase [Legionella steigerwaltii]
MHSSLEKIIPNHFNDPLINAVLTHYKLGQLVQSPKELNSGLTNRVLHVKTSCEDKVNEYVIKIVDRTAPRARTKHDYNNMERLQKFFVDEHQIPGVLAKAINYERVFEYDHFFVLVYPYVPSRTLAGPIGPVEAKQAFQAGKLLGQIHNGQLGQTLNLNNLFKGQIFEYNYSLNFIRLNELLPKYPQLTDKFAKIAEKTQTAYQQSRAHMVYGHGDYQPHNLLLVDTGTEQIDLKIIDWELAGLINPDMEFFTGLITFSGIATDNGFNENALLQFIDGYRSTGCKLQDNLENAFYASIHKCWINWIVFNMERKNQVEIDRAFPSLLHILEVAPQLFDYIKSNQLVDQPTAHM